MDRAQYGIFQHKLQQRCFILDLIATFHNQFPVLITMFRQNVC